MVVVVAKQGGAVGECVRTCVRVGGGGGRRGAAESGEEVDGNVRISSVWACVKSPQCDETSSVSELQETNNA